MKATLLDIDYIHAKKAVRLMLKSKGKTLRAYDASFKPYFYILPLSQDPKILEKLRQLSLLDEGHEHRFERIEPIQRWHQGKLVTFLRVEVTHPGLVPKFRDAVREWGEAFEHRIPFVRRYLIDKGLLPCGTIEVQAENQIIERVRPLAEEHPFDANVMAFDIETYNPHGVPDPRKDPLIMLSYSDGKDAAVLSWGKSFPYEFVHPVDSEKRVLEEFSRCLQEKKIDVLCTYNGDVFDLPYVRERARAVHAELRLGRDHALPKTKRVGLRNVTKLGGRIHFDVYNTVYFLDYIGAVKLQRLTLQRAYGGILGKEKEDLDKKEIFKAWDAGGEALAKLARYSRDDAIACFELAEHVLPLFVELAKITGATLFDASRFSAGQLVESLLTREAFARNEVVPNKPSSEEIAARIREPIQGAFVKTPPPGVYDQLAVFDFKSLYPSIIISHNIDPSTLNCSCCEKPHVSPQGYRFCKKRQGLIPAVLEKVLSTRFALQKEMKNHAADSREHKTLYAKQWALKILANSTYGVLLYPRFRWYHRECGEAVTAYGRMYIQETIASAEKAGFDVLYSDTDSIMLRYAKDKKEKVLAFQENINKTLPESMTLELEDFYPRGIFVSKKQEERGAKKKYALINEEGKIKIRGFELVRRDWSRIARQTQRQVLEILLKEGDVKKATELVRSTISSLKEGRVSLEECIIWTQLRKKVSAYEVQSPEVAAVLHARKHGTEVPEGSLVGYIITKSGKTISEKARLAELAKDYDAEYYIHNQVLPAVLKIIGALGFDKDSIQLKGSQTSLGSW